MGEEELFLTRLFLFLKLRKKNSQDVNKEPRFFMREIFETRLFVSFLIFVKRNDFSKLFRPVIPVGSTRVEVFLFILADFHFLSSCRIYILLNLLL